MRTSKSVYYYFEIRNPNLMHSNRTLLYFFIALMFMVTTALHAQTASARITGLVRDSSGAVIPGATVTALNEETGISYQAISSDAGAFAFDSIPPGKYKLEAELTGFKKFVSSGNIVTGNSVATINATLQVGNISESVEVAATYDKVETSQSGNLGATVNQKTITQMPLNGRNPLELIAIQAGVTQGSNTGGGTHVFGARDRAINITLDGIDANETSAGTATFTPIRTNPDSLMEYRVVTSNASAEFGRNSGAQMALITRSGTNDYHGSLFEFHRNRVLNANEWSLNRTATNYNAENRRFLLRNQFGASIGGPILKERTFFFFNFQIQRQIQTLQQVNIVYTQLARQGVFRYVKGGRNFPAGTADPSVDNQGNPLPGKNIGTYNVVQSDPRKLGLDPQIQSWIGLTKLPNRFDVGDGLNTAGFDFLATRTDPQRDFNLRIDHKINDNHSLFGRYSWGRQDTLGDTTNDGASRFPGLPPIVATFRTPRNLSLGYRWTINPRTVNELIVGGNHFGFSFRNPNPDFPNIAPWVTVNTTDPLSNYFGNERRINTFQIVDSISHVHGAHVIKGGINFRYQQHYDIRGTVAGLDVQPGVNLGGVVDPTVFNLPSDINITFDRPRLQGAINDLFGKLDSVSQAFVAVGDKYGPGGTPFLIDARYPEYDFFIQDDWRMRPNLTINAGLRWELRLTPRDPDNKIFAPDQPITLTSPPSKTIKFVQKKLYNNDLNNVGPAFGFSWDPFKDGKTAVRANYRIAYDRISTFAVSSAVFPVIPGITFGVLDTTLGNSDRRIKDGLPTLAPPAGVSASSLAQSATPSTLSMELMDPNFVSPMTQMWSLSLQRDLGRGFVVEASYIGRKADHLIGGWRETVNIRSNGFLDAFKVVKAGGDSALINQLVANHPSKRANETGSEFVRRFFSSTVNLNSVASLASSLNNTLVVVGGKRVNLPEAAGLTPYFFTRYPQFLGGLSVIDSNSFSRYHGLVLQVQRRFAQGLEFQANYTFSKSLDDKSYDPTFTRISTGTGQTASSTPPDPLNRRLTYGRSDFDRRHVFLANWLYDLPFGRGQRFLSKDGSVINHLVGGWSVAGILTLESGRPFTVYGGNNSFSNSAQSRANYSGGELKTTVRDDPSTGVPFLLTPEQRALFSTPAAGELGTSARNQFDLAGFYNLDASIIKKTYFGESRNVEFRAEFFNLTNTPSWGFPSSAVSTSTVFGRILGTASTARIIQLGLKVNF